MKDRIIELDLMRALAIVLIVLCHLHNYINSRFLEKYSYFPISFLGLNIFFMLSGFLLNQSRNIKSKDEIIIYVKKRVRRIYPLYWLAFVSFIVLDLLNIGEYTGTIRNTKLTFLFLNILGLQGLFPMQCTIYGTWFVGVILLYYFMYIFIRSYSKGINEIIIKSVIIMIPFVILRIKFGLIRPEVFIYYLVFVSGIIASEVRDFNKFLSVSVYYIAMMILLLIAYFCRLLPLKTILVLAQYQIFSFIGVFVVVAYSIYNSKQKSPNIFQRSNSKIVSKMAYSSYSVYLFHSRILTIIMLILYNIKIYDGFLYDFLIIAIGIPLVFIIGYYIQKISNL